GFVGALPFRLTGGQEQAIAEVSADMSAPTPMNRLLQGDVGSGKTIVALAASMRAVGSGHQATIMAPTEVLAGQHVRTVSMLLAPLGAINANAESPGASPRAAMIEGQEDLFGEHADSAQSVNGG